MDASERLAALLANELDADERNALEAELTRDPKLRASLAAMERADGHLRELSPPEPDEGFDQRLDAALAATLDEVLREGDDGARDGSTATTTSGDVFTARRRDRASRRTQTWIGIAAAAVILVGSGALLTSFGGEDRADDATTSMAESMDAGDAGDAAPEEAAELEAFALDAPVVVADGRTLDDDDLDDLLTSGELDRVRSRGLDESAGRELADRFQSDLGAGIDDAGAAGQQDDTSADAAPLQESAEDGADRPEAAQEPALTTRDGTPVPSDVAADVARCLDEVLEADADAIPAYTELATYEDTDVVVFGIVTVDPTTGVFSRNEVWVLERTSCTVLRFSQG